jgi:hypothetical protein
VAREGGALNRLREAAEERTGYTLRRGDELALLEASDVERRAMQREMDLLAYSALDYFGGNEQDLQAVERRKLAQRSRVAWQKDPQAGGAVDLLNDFTFGRGVPKPKCADPKVQEIVDEAWDDPDNKLILTTYAAQMALGVDLSTQSNIFFLLFDDGADGKVKVGILEHDAVENVVRDEEFRQRILYYVARRKIVKWDFVNDQAKVELERDRDIIQNRPVRYYEHWENVEVAEEERGAALEKAPPAKTGKGKVFHLYVNKTTEAGFGHPVMDRTLRWFTAYNNFMEARVDMARAAAALIMKRKAQGTPNQIERMAMKALSRRSTLGAAVDRDRLAEVPPGPKAASILNENDTVTMEPFKLDSGAGNAETDGQMIRSQISAATHFPQHYLGDAGSANLATATSMELPVLKTVEGRQEVFEGLFRWFTDRVIQRAVDAGKISKELDAEEIAKKREEEEAKKAKREGAAAQAAQAQAQMAAPGGPPQQQGNLSLTEAHAEAVEDEEDTERDLSYELSMPSPLRRMLGELVTAVEGIAKTFDPNGTNTELSRVLLGVALTDGLEVEDAQAIVERVFPPGYEDPALAAAMAAQREPPPGAEPGTGEGGGEEEGAENPYGGRMKSQTPEEAAKRPYGSMLAESIVLGRGGIPMFLRPVPAVVPEARRLAEANFAQLPAAAQDASNERVDELEQRFGVEVISAAEEALKRFTQANGNGSDQG